MQDNPAHRALDPHGQFQQALPQGGDLRRGTFGPLRPPPQLLQQDRHRGGEEHAELVGPEPRAARPIQRQAVKRQHEDDLWRGLGRVAVPNALERKYPCGQGVGLAVGLSGHQP